MKREKKILPLKMRKVELQSRPCAVCPATWAIILASRWQKLSLAGLQLVYLCSQASVLRPARRFSSQFKDFFLSTVGKLLCIALTFLSTLVLASRFHSRIYEHFSAILMAA